MNSYGMTDEDVMNRQAEIDLELLNLGKNIHCAPEYVGMAARCLDFDNIRLHDWRRYVPAEIRQSWHNLSLETKVACVLICQPIAMQEEYD